MITFLRALLAPKLHYWCVSVINSNGVLDMYVGYPDKLMTAARLALLIQENQLPDDTRVLAVSKLGRMTEKIFQTKY